MTPRKETAGKGRKGKAREWMEMEGQARERNITIYPSEDNFLNLSTHIFSRTHLTFYPKYPKLLTFLSFKSDFELFPQSSASRKLKKRTSTTKYIIYLPQKKNIDLSIHNFSRIHLTFYPKYPKLLTFLSFKSDFKLFPHSTASHNLVTRTSTTE